MNLLEQLQGWRSFCESKGLLLPDRDPVHFFGIVISCHADSVSPVNTICEYALHRTAVEIRKDCQMFNVPLWLAVRKEAN